MPSAGGTGSVLLLGLLLAIGALRLLYVRLAAEGGSASADGVAGAAGAGKDAEELEGLRASRAGIAGQMPLHVLCWRVVGGAPPEPPATPSGGGAGAKMVHFIRHGEGVHNVAQRQWRARPEWDGVSEPYTLDNDPGLAYVDAVLTDRGRGQARDLQARTAPLRPDLLVVSPMRRATQTGLIAFDRHISAGSLRVVASELCHERAGRHTCDKRLPRSELASAFPSVDYSGVDHEDDPFWGDGRTRESPPELAARAAEFVLWLLARPEQHLAVAAHSAFLLAVFNAVLDCGDNHTSSAFATGEMRTVMLAPESEVTAE